MEVSVMHSLLKNLFFTSLIPLTETAVPRSPAAEPVTIEALLADDRRYKIEAYQFVASGLEYAQEVLGLGKLGLANAAKIQKQKQNRSDSGQAVRHVAGQELCWALKELAHRNYGLMAKLVLADWGIRSTSDFGEIVYNLIRIGKMTQSERDRRSDFDDVYDFQQALVRDYAITNEQEEICRP
jgi:uncharacterized repeat protein (TIGR04138 family)